MGFFCFFCRESDVIEWHDVEEGFEPYQPPRRSSRATGSGSGLQVNRDSGPSYRIIAETQDEPEARGKYDPPRPPLNKRSRSGTSKGVRFVKVDIRVPRQAGQGTKKVVRLVKIDIRPRPGGEDDDNGGRREEFGAGLVSSPNEGWPFRQSRLESSTKREIREGSESPDVGFFNSPNRERAAKIMRGNRRHQQQQREIHEGLDVGFLGSSPSSGRASKQRPTRPRQEIFECEAPKEKFNGSPSNRSRSPNKIWPSSRRNRPHKEIFQGPSGANNRSVGSGGLQSPNRPRKESSERPVSHSWAIRGLESPSRIVQKTYGRAMSYSGAMRGLLSPNSPADPEEASYEGARSGSGGLKGLQSPNRTVQEVYERAMSHSGAIRSLQSPNRTVYDFFERARSPSGEMRSSQSPDRNLQEVHGRPLSHSGAIRCLQSPNGSPGGGNKSSHSPNRSRQVSGRFRSPPADAGSRRTSRSGGLDPKRRWKLYRQPHGGPGDIKSAGRSGRSL